MGYELSPLNASRPCSCSPVRSIGLWASTGVAIQGPVGSLRAMLSAHRKLPLSTQLHVLCTCTLTCDAGQHRVRILYHLQIWSNKNIANAGTSMSVWHESAPPRMQGPASDLAAMPLDPGPDQISIRGQQLGRTRAACHSFVLRRAQLQAREAGGALQLLSVMSLAGTALLYAACLGIDCCLVGCSRCCVLCRRIPACLMPVTP